MSELREYQHNALNKLRAALAEGKRRIILYSPTGSGKTVMGLAMIRGAIAKGKRVAFICNRIDLVGQTSRRFTEAGLAHDVVQGQNTRLSGRGVVICSIQTVARRGMPDADLIVIDEAHAVAGSKAYRDLLFQRSALPVIGLTATPFSKGLGKWYKELGGELFEAIVEAATIRELIEIGFLVDCEIYAPSEPDLSGVRTVAGDWHEADLGVAVDKPTLIGDIVQHWFKLANGKPTVCFATNIAHSQHIVEQFKANGVSAEHIDCYTSENERQMILNRVLRGETKVISNVSILAEGWDFPACEVMILARPTKSLIRYIQMVGRVLRPFDGKGMAMILDHSGSCPRLGYPTDDLPLELCDGKPGKTKTTKQEEALPKKCPQCHFMKPPKSRVCPKCGHTAIRVDKTEVGDGELVKMERKKKAERFPDKQALYSELLQVAREKNYHHGWVAHKFKMATGNWPKGMKEIPAYPSPETLNYLKYLNIRRATGLVKGARR